MKHLVVLIGGQFFATYSASRKNTSPYSLEEDRHITHRLLTQHGTIYQVNACPFHSCLTSVSVTLSSPLPPCFQFFHCYMGKATWENNASSCFGCTLTEEFSLCHNATFIFVGKIKPRGKADCILKAKTIGNQFCHFFTLCQHYLIQNEVEIEAKKLTIASFTKFNDLIINQLLSIQCLH